MRRLLWGRRAIAPLLLLIAAHISSAAENQIDLAAVITKADAQSLLGEPVKDGQARNEDGADGSYSRCNYYSENPGRSLTLRVRQAGPGQLDPKKQLEDMSAGNDKFKAVTGLGDKAALMKEGPAKGPGHVLMLYVAKGNAFITVGISGVDDEKSATEKAKTLAKKILGKL
jgi:hypothetical protein